MAEEASIKLGGEKKNNPGKTEVVLLRKQESFLRNAERHPLINQEPGPGWFSTSGALSKGPSVIWGAWSEWQMRRGGCVGSQGTRGDSLGGAPEPSPGRGHSTEPPPAVVRELRVQIFKRKEFGP